MADCPSVTCQQVAQVEAAYQASQRPPEPGTGVNPPMSRDDLAARVDRVSRSVIDPAPQVNAAGYTVRMTDGQEYVWDGVSTVYTGTTSWLLAPQGTRLNPAHVVAMTPING
jgi:hypothetical protein